MPPPVSYLEEYCELRRYPLDGPLRQTARLAYLWRNAPQEGLVDHTATREEAATNLDAMERELHQRTTRRRRMEQQLPQWQNAEYHAWKGLKTQAEDVNTIAVKLQRVTQRVADEEHHARPRDAARVAVYHSALAGYTADLAEAVAKMQALAARTPAMTLHNFYELEYKPALQAAREQQTFTIAYTGLAWQQRVDLFAIHRQHKLPRYYSVDPDDQYEEGYSAFKLPLDTGGYRLCKLSVVFAG